MVGGGQHAQAKAGAETLAELLERGQQQRIDGGEVVRQRARRQLGLRRNLAVGGALYAALHNHLVGSLNGLFAGVHGVQFGSKMACRHTG